MKILVSVILAATLLGSVLTEHEEVQVLQANGEFGNQLYTVLATDNDNLAFSPISLHAALSMAYQGAQGTTAAAFANTLRVPEARTTALGYHEIIPQINSAENVTLHMADKVYLMQGQRMLEGFSTSLTRDFYSEVEQLNFARSEEAADIINAWVEEETHGKIKDLVSSDDLDDSTRLVLVNALYFKSQWLYKFNNTDINRFYLSRTEAVDVEMMHLTLNTQVVPRLFGTKYDRELDARILELPYANDDFSMVIILPNAYDGLRSVETKLNDIDLSTITKNLEYVTATVSLPKFKIEQTIDLQDTLTQLGLGVIFDPLEANFRGMLELQPEENLYVSKVLQKVFVEVNEEGAEAAAATEQQVVPWRFTGDLPFRIDHPFIFLIKETSTRNALFYGKVNKL